MTDDKRRRHDGSTPFKTLVAEASDFDLVDNTYFKIGRKYDIPTDTADRFWDTSRLSPVERNVVIVCNCAHLIGIGGFEYALSERNEDGFDCIATAQAHKEVGLNDAYDALQRVLAAFPGQSIPVDPKHRTEQYKLQDETTRDRTESLFWQNDREPVLAAFIRSNADKFCHLDEKDPSPWDQAKEFISSRGVVPIVAFGALTACVSATTRGDQHGSYLTTSFAGIAGSFLAWVGRRAWKWKSSNQNIGWIKRMLEETGPEYLTVWKPLDHDITDDDIEYAINLGKALNEEKLGMNEQGRCISFLTVESQHRRVGVIIKGWDPDDMLTAVRPFFQKHFPRGSFVTGMPHLETDEDRNSLSIERRRVPLFEDDEVKD